MSRQQSTQRACQVRLFRKGRESHHDERTCPACCAAHSQQFGDVISTVPPQLQGQQTLPSGRNTSLAVNPAEVQGTPVYTAPGGVPVDSAINLGGGTGTQGLFAGKTVNGFLEFRNITPGFGIDFTVGTEDDVIINSSIAALTGLANEGTGTGLIFDTVVGSTAYLRSLQVDPTAGNEGVAITTTGLVVNIGNTMTGGNLGTGTGTLFASKTSPGVLNFNSLAGGLGISVSAPASNVVTIANTLTGQSIATGQAIYSGQVGADLQFKGLLAGAGIALSSSATDVTVTSSIAATAVLQGGNSFGATMIVGTNDANSLVLRTNGAAALTLSTAQAASFANSITAGVNGTAGGSLTLNGSTSGGLTMSVPAAVTPYAVTWPAAQGGVNALLTNNGSGALSWQTNPGNFFAQGGNAFGAPAVLGTNDSNSLTLKTSNTTALTISTTQNVALAGALSVAAGISSGVSGAAGGSLVLSGAASGALTLIVPAAVTSYSLTWPPAQGGANTVLTDNGGGVLSWQANPGNFFAQGGNSFGAAAILGTNDANNLTIQTNGLAAIVIATSQNVAFSASVSAAGSYTSGTNGSAAGSLTLQGSATGSATIRAGAAITTYTVTWPLAQGSAGSFLTNDGTGTLTWSSNPDGFFMQGGNSFGAAAVLGTNDSNGLTIRTNGLAALTITNTQQATFAKTLTVAGTSVTIGSAGAGGTLVLAGTTAGTFTQGVPATVTAYVVTWPGAQATAAGQVLVNDGTGVLSWAVPGGGTFYAQGGNSFGAAAVLGTNDANSLTLRTNGAAALTLSTSQAATFASTLAISGASVTVGVAGTVGGALVLSGGAAGTLTQNVPATVTAYSITWPAAVATTTGSFLTSSATGALSWATPAATGFYAQGGNSFGAAATLGTNDNFSLALKTNNVAALSITNTQAATFASTLAVSGASVSIGAPGVTGGTLVLSGSTAGTLTQNAPAAITTYAITWPSAVATAAGSFLTSSATGALSWTTPAATGFYAQGGNSFGAAATLGTNDNFSLTLKTNNTAALSITNTQAATFAGALTVSGDSVSIGTAGSVGGSLVLNGSTTGAFTQNVPATVTSYAVTWPAIQATAAGQVLTNNGSGTLTWATPGGGTYYAQGGNSFGAAATLGTNDNFSLALKTNNTPALSITNTQAATFASTLAVSGASVTIGATGTIGGTLVLSCSTAGALTQAVPATITTPYTITWPATQASAAGQVLTNNGSGLLAWAVPGGGTYYAQGGNSFGAAATLGTNDNFSLALKTNNITALSITNTQAATFAGTLAVNGATVTIGISGTVGGALVLSGSTAGSITQAVPASVTAYTVTWPAAAPTVNGSYLGAASSGALSWNNPNGGAGIGVFLQGGNSFGVAATLGTNDANGLVLETNGLAALSITSAQVATFSSALTVSGASVTVGVAGVTGGSLILSGSAAGGFTQAVPATVTTYSVTWPAAQATAAGQVLTNNGSGALTWATPGGGTFFAQGGNSFGAAATLGTNDNFSLALKTNNVAALSITNAQAATFASTLAVSGASVTIGAIGVTGGTLILSGSAAGTLTQAVPATVTTYSITWPAAQATSAGQVLTNNGSGALTWAAPGGGTFFAQGGNSFGAAATLGTNDANSLTLKTNNTTALTISTTQVATFASTLAVQGASLTVGIAGTTGGSLSLAGTTAGTLTQNVPTTVTTYSVTWPAAVATTAGSYLASATSGVLSWNSPNGGAGIGVFLQGGNSFGALASLGTNDANSLALKTNNTAALTITSAQAATFASTLTVSGATITVGTASATTGSIVMQCTANANAITLTAPNTIAASYTAIWPAAQASAAGQVLTNNGAGILSWAAPGGGTFFAQGGNSFGTTATLGTNDANSLVLETNGAAALTITSAKAATFASTLAVQGASLTVGVAGTTGGALILAGSTTGTLTQAVPASIAVPYTVTWPAAQATAAGQVLTNNGSGVLSWASPGGGTFFAQGGNSFGAAATLGTNDANSLILETNNTAALTITSAQLATFASNLTVTGTLSGLAGATVGTSLTIGSPTTTTGSITFRGGTGGQMELTVPNSPSVYIITLPGSAPAANGSYLAATTGGTCSWNSPNGGAGVGMFLQGGNSFGATATLGTNDANSLVLETNNTAVLTMTSAQAATFASMLTVQGTSLTVGVAGTTGGSVVLAGSAAGTFTENVPATVTTYSVTWPAAQATAAGQVLTNNGSGVLSWASPGGGAFFAQGGNSFGATATLGTNDANSLILETNNTAALTITSAQLATFASNLTVTGTLSGLAGATVGTSLTIGSPTTTTGSITFRGGTGGQMELTVPNSPSVYIMTLPGSAPAANGSYLAATTGGTCSWNSPNGGAGVGMFLQGGNSFGATATLGTNDANSLVLETNNTAALTITSAQLATFASNLTVTGTLSGLAGATVGTSLTIGSPTTTTGSITFRGGTGGQMELTVPNSPSVYIITLPGSAPAANGSYLAATTGGTCSWNSPNGGAGVGMFLQGGNSFGATATLGTNDANSLVLETNNTAALTMTSAQAATFASMLTVQGASLTVGVAGTTGGSVVLAGSAAGTFTENVPATVTTYSVTWPATQATAAGQVLTNNGSGVLTWASPGGGAFFAQGGNAFGVQATLGTTDANSLVLETNSVTALTITSAQAATFAKALTVQGASLTVGVAGTTGGSIILTGATAGTFTENVPATVTTYSVTWPATQATAAGQVLTNNGSGALSWASPGGGAFFAQGGNSFGATATLGTNDANSLILETNGVAALTITSAQLATFASNLTVTGTLSGLAGATVGTSLTIGSPTTTTGSITFRGGTGGQMELTVPNSPSVYIITLPGSAPAANGSYLAATTGGTCSWNSPNGGAGVGMFLQGGNSFGATATLGTNDTNSLVLETNNTAALTITSAQLATFASNLTVTGTLSGLAGATVGTSLTIGSPTTTTGSITFRGGTGGQMELTVPNSPSVYIITLPGSAPTANGSYLAATTSGTCSWNSPNGGAGVGMFLQGGNSFGATATLGTNDANSLILETNGTAALTMTSAQAATFASTLTVQGASLTVGVAGTTGGSMILSGSAAGSFTQQAPATVTTYAITWPAAQGAASTVLTNNGSGGLSWAAAAASSPWSRIVDATTSENEIVYNTGLPTAATDNWLAGPQTTEGASTRAMMINSSTDSGTGSFRAGTVNGTQWNQSNRGAQSVAFGLNNTASGAQSGALSGSGNTAAGAQCVVIGGATNSTAAATSGSAIIAGTGNQITTSGATYAVICGGNGNAITGAQAAIIGGVDNTITGGTNSFIGGGNNNTTVGAGCFIGAGDGNQVTGALTTNATIGGGQSNTVSASGACVPGGVSNTASGVNSFACGEFANASLANTFVFNDGSNSAFVPGAANTFNVIASNGMYTPVSYTAGSQNGTTGSLVLVGNNNTVLANSLTQTVPAAMTAYTITWPNAQGGVSTVLTNDGSGGLSWAAAGSANAFVQGGNSFGAAATLGTNDANSLTIRTNSVAALTITSAQAATFSKTLVVQGASLTVGVAGTTGGSLILAGATAGTFTENVPATVTTYSVTWPAAQATAAGQVLTNNGSGVLSWASPGGGAFFAQGGNAFGAQATLGTTDANSLVVETNSVTALTITSAQAATFAKTLTVQGASLTVGVAGTTGGSIILAGATAGTFTENVPTTVTTYSVTWPAAQASAAGQVLTNNGSGALSWALPGGGTFFAQNGNSFGATATLGTNDANSLILETNGTAALTITSAQLATFASNLTVTGTLSGLAGATVGTTITIGSPTTSTGSITFRGGTGGQMSLTVPNSPSVYTMTLPGSAPAANGSYLAATTSGTCSWNSPNGGAGVGMFLQGGNSFGATATLGTNDANSLILETNGTAALTITSAQLATFASNLTVTGTLSGLAGATVGTSLTIGSPTTTTGSITFRGGTGGQMELTVPNSPSVYIITLPGSAPAANGSYLAATTSGTCSWNSPNGGAGVGMFLQGGNSFGATATLGTNDANSLVLETNNTAALTITSAQLATFASNLTVTGTLSGLAGATVGTTLTIGSPTTSTGSITFRGGTGGQMSLTVPNAPSVYIMTLPGSAPSANGSYLAATTSGTCSWNSPNGGAGVGMFLQGGNSFGATATLGTNDANSLVLETNNTAALTITSAQAATFAGTLTANGGVITAGVAGTTGGSLVLAGSTAGALTQNVPATVTSYAATWPAAQGVGALVNNGTGTLSWVMPSGYGYLPNVAFGSSTTQLITSSTTYVSTGLSATITPQFTNSKVYIAVACNTNASPNVIMAITVARGTTELTTGTSPVTSVSVNTTRGSWGSVVSGGIWNMPASFNWLDSPATTAATTYTVYVAVTPSSPATWNGTPGVATIYLQEQLIGPMITGGPPSPLSVINTTTTGLATSSLTYVSTGFSATITPQYANSKVLVTVSGDFQAFNASISGYATIARGTTDLATGVSPVTGITAGSSFPLIKIQTNGLSNGLWASQTMSYLDSPATTAAVTYTLYIAASSGGNIGWLPGNLSTGVITLQEQFVGTPGQGASTTAPARVILNAVTIGTAATSLGTLSYTFPALGGPYRAFAQYNIAYSSLSSVSNPIIFYVSDGTNNFAGSQYGYLIAGNSTGNVGSGISYNATYTAGQTVTFTVFGQGTSVTGTSTSVASTPANNDTRSDLVIYAVPA
jgi:ethanolamine utilization microcompartment shell protein EutS